MDALQDIVPPNIFDLVPLLGLYAESHFRFRIPISRYFRRQPELIFDMPWRLQPGQKPILFLIVKDAHRFPVTLGQIDIDILQSGIRVGQISWTMDKEIRTPMEHIEIELDHINLPVGEITILPSLGYQVGRKHYRMTVDNYLGTDKAPLRVTIAKDHLPTPANWVSGDLHLHSHLTNDQIEFGAPLLQTRKAAELFGLDFITSTDHSYDLDDDPDDYLTNDPSLEKWTCSRQEIQSLNEGSQLTIIPGEEISVANHRGATVHFLHYNDHQYFHGSGDSGDTWPNMDSEHTIDDVLEQRSPETVSVAAHTAYKFPRWQQILLKRGWWESEDHKNPLLDGVQILCGTPAYEAFHQSRRLWIDALLAGRRLALYGGSDGHGNFNRNWHIKIPLWSIGTHEDQIFGQVRTLLRSKSTEVEDLVSAMQHKRTALTTGPVGDLTLRSSNGDVGIGDVLEVAKGTELVVTLKGSSSAEFGLEMDVTLYQGHFGEEDEKIIEHFQDVRGPFEKVLPITVSQSGYLRLEISSEGSRWPGVYMSSPIWINVK